MSQPTYRVYVKTAKGDTRVSEVFAASPEEARKALSVRRMLQRTNGTITAVRPWKPSDKRKEGRRPAGHQRVQLHLDPALLARVDQEAQAQGKNRSEFIESVLKQALNWTDE